MQELNILNEGYNYGKLASTSKNSKIKINNRFFIDLSFSAGSILLGHNNKIFKKIINELLKKNISNYAFPNIYANKFSKTLKKIFPFYKKFIFCNSGSEAIMKGIRICRAVSKKKIIVNTSGSWHGSVNETLYTSTVNYKPIKLSDGLPANTRNDLKFIPYGDKNKTKKILDKYKSRICCILIEPIQGALPTDKNLEYIKFLSNYANKNKIIIFFDEIITGLRDSKNSFQTRYNFKPTLSVFGKSFAGGLPIGIIALSSTIYKKINSKKLNIFFGGTFSGNSITTFVANSITNYLIKNKKIRIKIEKKINKFKSELNEFISENKLDARVYSYSSMARIVFSKKNILNRSQRDFFEKNNKATIMRFSKFMWKNGIYFPRNGIIFFSYSHTKKEINFVKKIVKKGLLLLK